MNALTVEPKPVTLNKDGKATSGYETIEVPMPAQTHAKVSLYVGYFPRHPDLPPDELPGWRAMTRLSGRVDGNEEYLLVKTRSCRERQQAIADAIEGLVNRLVDAGDRPRCRQRDWINTVIAALNAWADFAAKPTAKKDHTESRAMTRSPDKPPRILSSKECHTLLDDFRSSYEAFEHSFIELGEKAAQIREQEAYGTECGTFDEWIKANRYSRTVIYDSMKAARFFRITSPITKTLKIVLDRESHFREFPAEATAGQAKAIVKEIERSVEPENDGLRHPTARQIKEAVAAVCPARAKVEGRGMRVERSAAAKPPDEVPDRSSLISRPSSPPSPRLAPETIEGEYVEVVPEAEAMPAAWRGKAWAHDLSVSQAVIRKLVSELLDRHGGDALFLREMHLVLHDLSIDAKHYEAPAGEKKRRAK